MPKADLYTHTSSSLAVLAECTGGFVQRQAKAGRVPCLIAANGIYLYPASAVPIVKRLKAEGVARRGGSHGRVAAVVAG